VISIVFSWPFPGSNSALFLISFNIYSFPVYLHFINLAGDSMWVTLSVLCCWWHNSEIRHFKYGIFVFRIWKKFNHLDVLYFRNFIQSILVHR
jgi:hypothetical protein